MQHFSTHRSRKCSTKCLLSLVTKNSIPNIEPGCNSIGFCHMFGVNDNITIPTGMYELEDLEYPDYITFFELKSDSITLKCKISCSHETDFSIENSIATLLGFRNVVYTTGNIHESENTVNIMKTNCIKIECNLITDSFCDGSPSQTIQYTIHEFYPTVAVGYKIVEVPRHIVFYGLKTCFVFCGANNLLWFSCLYCLGCHFTSNRTTLTLSVCWSSICELYVVRLFASCFVSVPVVLCGHYVP
ncbi:Uncharacterized protein FWK35_00018421 [Aphis craccivora]|uniref:Uncharacterized protein n=1 Tax=Aphis craccivora TaxID=307492 RepID=A0A6G0Y5W3_APHCR|nr:Uncharacterized protein FWK35_00018421 [Aphis craccivora]